VIPTAGLDGDFGRALSHSPHRIVHRGNPIHRVANAGRIGWERTLTAGNLGSFSPPQFGKSAPYLLQIVSRICRHFFLRIWSCWADRHRFIAKA
jgi:hypothetical protein